MSDNAHVEHKSDALDPDQLLGHAADSTSFHFPKWLGGHVEIPQPFASPLKDSDGRSVVDTHHAPQFQPIWQANTGIKVIDTLVKPLDLVVTKFMVLEVVAAVLIVALFGWLATRIKRGQAAKGKLANALEAMLVFIRDEVARPAIGHHDGDRFLPFLWTVFFFVLTCNLLGMVPWLGSPTGAFAVTAVLALCTFLAVVATGIRKMGVIGFLKSQVPHMDLPPAIRPLLVPMIFAIELLGLLIKHSVLSVRLLANMTGGHVVLAVITAFIAAGTGSIAWFGIVPASVLGAVAIDLLELFVAFLQAYIFTFLSALFIGAAVHPH